MTAEETGNLTAELDRIVEIEKQFLKDEEDRKRAEELAAAEAERKRVEQEKLERQRREEEERIRLEHEEAERRRLELIQKQQAEQAAREKAEREERERREKEEEIKQIARRKRQMEERQRREEEQRVREERARIREEKKLVRSSLGSAMDQQISTNEEAVSSSFVSEYESPEIAAKKAKEAQQQREQERRERERAERESFENKNINEIFKEYSKNPYYMAKRGITYVLAHAFGIIPVVTDNPDYIRMFKVKKEKEQAEAERKRAEREIEIIYEKYAPYLKYDVKRRIKNRQFKKRKRLERKNRPPRPYIPPQRTAEEQKAIDTEMKRLYKEYHVSAVGRLVRHLKEKYRKKP